MDLGPEQIGGARRNVLSATAVSVAGEVAPLDWHGLAARLAAAQSARQVLARAPCERVVVGGSFSPAAARRIAIVLRNAGDQPGGFHHAALTQSLKPIASRHAP